jgi:hypothetical protein
MMLLKGCKSFVTKWGENYKDTKDTKIFSLFFVLFVLFVVFSFLDIIYLWKSILAPN